MMNKKDKDLNKFEFDKIWQIRRALQTAVGTYKIKYNDTGWDFVKEQQDEVEAALELLEEVNDFLMHRYMLKYDNPEYGTFEPEFMTEEHQEQIDKRIYQK